jgi:hypothetical protein
MGRSDDERVLGKKMMDHRQRKVKGREEAYVYIYITNDRAEKRIAMMPSTPVLLDTTLATLVRHVAAQESLPRTSPFLPHG